MAFTLYDALVPQLSHMLENLSNCLDKGEAHAKETGADPNTYMQACLAPDMFPLTRQIYIATDQAKGAVARLAGIEIPKYEDTESTFADLKARIAKTVAFLKSVKPEQFQGAEGRAISLSFPQVSFRFDNGVDYFNKWVLPNVYFHITAAYAILRHKGVPVGKADYLRVPPAG